MQLVTRYGTIHASLPQFWPNRPEGLVRHISNTGRYGTRRRTLHLFALGPLALVVLTGRPFGR